MVFPQPLKPEARCGEIAMMRRTKLSKPTNLRELSRVRNLDFRNSSKYDYESLTISDIQKLYKEQKF